MQLRHTIAFFKKVGGLPKDVTSEWSYRSDTNVTNVDTDDLDPEHINAIFDHAFRKASSDEAAETIVKRIESYRKLVANPEGQAVGRLDRLATVLTEYLRPAKHKFVFKEEKDGQMCPYYVERIEYIPPDKRHESPAKVKMHCKAISFDAEDNEIETWEAVDLSEKKTAPEILRAAGFHRETPAAYAAYENEVELFNATIDNLGLQYSATGLAFDREDSWGRDMIAMERDGERARLVIDREGDESERRGKEVHRTASTVFWSSSKERNDEEEECGVASIPVHPYVQAFDLGLHQYVGIHVNLLTPYKYNKGVAEKLVLPAETKELVNVLMEQSAEAMEDIVSGKTGGTVVITTGPPGTGKTLTAEVYSEQIERPLYTVQCSQLGTDEEELEKKLMKTLRRASRWGAILLIDEADVYVRERGDDIQQNAIVGVFLRLLERYRGILFLTSNRATIIDDAILSRAIAHVRYAMPDDAELFKLWEVLGANYKASLSTAQIGKLVRDLPNLSGRNVKNILKLATIVARGKKETVNPKHMRYAAKFIDIPREKTEDE